MSVFIGDAISAPAGKGPIASASLTPKSGVTYTAGLSGLEPAILSLMSAIISNNSDITSETTTVYVDIVYGNIHRKINVGNQVTIALNGTDYAFDVIGFNHDALTDASSYGKATATGKAGITFQMHDMFATYYPMNSSNTSIGGWKSCAMRTSTMATMKVYLPAAWQTAIKPVNKVSSTGDGSSSGTETVSDSCFLLSEIEIFGYTTYSVSGEGTQYAYYKAGNSKVKNKGGSADLWWERSPYRLTSYSFCTVDENGNAATLRAANNIAGVAFGFCV